MAKDKANGHLKPTPGSVWRRPREEGYTMTLPSGNVATLRPVSLSVLMLEGKIPDLLSPLAAESVWMGLEDEKLSANTREAFQEIAEVAPEMLKLYNIVARASLVNPRIVDEPKEEDEISLADLDDEDKATIYVWCTNGVRALEFFRDRQSGDVEGIHDGEGVRDAAVEPGTD